MSLSDIPRVIRDLVSDGDDGRCQYCSMKQFGQGAMFHINHVVPRSRGGPTVVGNLVLQCPYCSSHKSNKAEGIDPFPGEAASLFHRLRQSWPDRFEVDRDGTCRGLTAVGRATVVAPAMNDDIPETARALQVRLGII